MKIYMQMKPSFTHHALSIQLNNTPNLVKLVFSSIGDTTYSRFRVRSVSDTAPLRMRRESSGAPHTSLVYNT